ncbi:hypothetical protein NS228_23835 [Methylobacterium indicum]|uniref:hypothetical protein n=1 Tax=Methylobacterium indicum TaxID=1775910 RepID=UPI000734E110|nr:hypothetical protein [Methylobacterium indicum]KTS25896.1 hypothetical protein NS229_18880 [Methylobacterium indicum]KTS30705.1 hypothetical protein NS228_23835 [Methylobacterium indicum]KTS52511.1 hypothetical protein NS230_09440 [Methylobacterium indicum]
MRSIRRLKEHADLCIKLGQSSHPATGAALYRTYRELSCFVAMLGFEQGRERDLDGPTELFVDGRIFEGSETAVDVLYLIGIASMKSTSVLDDTEEAEEKLVKAFERFVAGGLDIVAEWMAAEPSDTNGDKAVLTALRRGGYLERIQTAEDALARVVF